MATTYSSAAASSTWWGRCLRPMAVAALLLLAFPGCGSSEDEPPKGPHTIELHVHGIKDKVAQSKVYDVLARYPGVTKVKVDPDGDVAVRVKDGQVTRAEALEEALAKAGFKAHTGEH